MKDILDDRDANFHYAGLNGEVARSKARAQAARSRLRRNLSEVNHCHGPGQGHPCLGPAAQRVIERWPQEQEALSRWAATHGAESAERQAEKLEQGDADVDFWNNYHIPAQKAWQRAQRQQKQAARAAKAANVKLSIPVEGAEDLTRKVGRLHALITVERDGSGTLLLSKDEDVIGQAHYQARQGQAPHLGRGQLPAGMTLGEALAQTAEQYKGRLKKLKVVWA